MTKIEEIKYYFSGWNFKGLAILVLFLLALTLYGANMPLAEKEEFGAKVLSLGITNSTTYSLSKSTARVRLSNGKKLDITLPRDVVVQPGDHIVVQRRARLFKGYSYAFSKVGESP